MNIRQMNIMQYLLRQQKYVSAQKLAKVFSVSKKTIYTDFEIIQTFLVSKNAYLEKVPSLGTRLVADKQVCSQLIVEIEQKKNDLGKEKWSPEEREENLVSALFLEHNELDILDWSIEHYISESSVKRSLEKLEHKLHREKLMLAKKGDKVRVVGDEADIRIFLRNYLVSSQQIANIHKSDQAEILAKVRHFSKAYHFQINEQYEPYLVWDLWIAKTRYQSQSFLKETNPKILDNLKLYESYLFASELLASVLKVEISSLPEAEIAALTRSLLSVGYEMLRPLTDEKFETTVHAFIAMVSELIDVDFSDDEHLYQMLLNHIQPMVFRLRNRIHLSNLITEEIKQQYSVLYHVVWLAVKVLNDYFGIELTDVEVAFLTMHFAIAVEKKSQPSTIYIVCQHGVATSELIVSQLRKLFSSDDKIVKLTPAELVELDVDSLDLVISSVDLTDYPKDYIHVGTVLTDIQRREIQQSYLKITKSSRKILRLLENNEVYSQSLVNHLLARTIYLHQKVDSVSECLDKIIQLSHPANLADKHYTDSIYQREELGITSTYTGIALPHANPEFVHHSQLIMMTLDKPILWGVNFVKVVLLIAIEERDLETYKEALIEIYSRVDSASYIEQLGQAQTLEEFKKSLFAPATFDTI